MAQTTHLADQDLLLALDDQLPPERVAPAQAHLATCARCRGRMQEFLQASARLGETSQADDWMADALRGRARTRLEARLREARSQGPASPLLQWRAYLAGAPLAAFVLTVAFLAAVAVTSRRSASHPTSTDADVRGEEPGVLPIRSLTPGATLPLAVAELCRSIPWEPSPIPATVRAEVLRGYGMEHVPAQEYELDYLVTPDLGGAPEARNLWPERYGSRIWNAKVKDELETLLTQLVCQGELDLVTAQRDIADDWIAAYKKYFKTDRPIRLYSMSSFQTDRIAPAIEMP
ncbi:MAG: hypothetical protein ABL961_05020 [Vicinamibacterales bacterium]